ncbi:MAG: hypothetical protein KF769_09735 [Parvibaculum sp.]|nr:hypothetical protein [Parvibaculum sp.]
MSIASNESEEVGVVAVLKGAAGMAFLTFSAAIVAADSVGLGQGMTFEIVAAAAGAVLGGFLASRYA